MGRRIIFSPLAETDLQEIMQYTVERWSERQWIKYKAGIDKATYSIALKPESGAHRPDLPEDIRCRRAGRHFLLYRIEGDIVHILRVLHERMDFVRHME